MKIDLNFNLKNLSGEDLITGKGENGETTYQNAGKLLANLLVGQTEGDTIKYYDWALKLHGGNAIDLDRSDQDKLKKFIEGNKQMTILAKAQILEKFK